MAGVFTQGIDVSHHQGPIKWDRVANDGIYFAFIKASEAFTFKDRRFEINTKGCRDNGIRCGGYHFFRPGKDGRRQADNLLAQLEKADFGQPGDLLPVLDCEDFDGSSKARYREDLQTCLDRVESQIGKKPIIYTLKSFWKIIGDPDLSAYPLWVVDLSFVDFPRLPKHWTDYAVWQYSFTGSVDGISGDVDRDRFNGSPDELDDISIADGPRQRPTLRRGARGALVRELQQALGITVDGIFGPGTETAVKRFQRDNGLVADGIVGPRTWAALDKPEEPEPTDRPTLRRGAEGAAVRELQQALGITVDGDFGPATEAAVRQFQRDNSLVADGIVGPRTWAVLGR